MWSVVDFSCFYSAFCCVCIETLKAKDSVFYFPHVLHKISVLSQVWKKGV